MTTEEKQCTGIIQNTINQLNKQIRVCKYAHPYTYNSFIYNTLHIFSLPDICNKFEVKSGLRVMHHIGTLLYSPFLRVNFRKKCIRIIN